MRLFRRKRAFVDARIQGALLLRIVAYWFCCLLAAGVLLIYWKIITGSPEPFRLDTLWQEHRSVVLASLIMLPIFLVDTVIVSNRFSGPFYRIRRSIHDLAAGKPFVRLQFRKQDYWHEVADDLNKLAQYIEQLKQHAADVPDRDSTTQNRELESATAP
jgi:hypothetical protein